VVTAIEVRLKRAAPRKGTDLAIEHLDHNKKNGRAGRVITASQTILSLSIDQAKSSANEPNREVAVNVGM
jgi:predicted RNA-binding protein YlqC (UPF0109 family)